MNVTSKYPEILQITGVKELGGASAYSARDQIKRSLEPVHGGLEIDLSETTFMDSIGLDALIALHKTMLARGGQLRLINPSLVCRKLLELTRLHRIIEIVTR
jgi:anti-anti-sigma factor